jgi:hypothetical protein
LIEGSGWIYAPPTLLLEKQPLVSLIEEAGDYHEEITARSVKD